MTHIESHGKLEAGPSLDSRRQCLHIGPFKSRTSWYCLRCPAQGHKKPPQYTTAALTASGA